MVGAAIVAAFVQIDVAEREDFFEETLPSLVILR